MKKQVLIEIFLMLIMFYLIMGCSSWYRSGTDSLSLEIGLMPAVDSAPVFLADKKGYFEKLGLKTKLTVFNNAQDRQSALQTYSIDGAITDLIAVSVNVENGFDIKATTMTSGIFPVLYGKGSLEKKKLKAGIMEVSVTNFLLDEWLADKYDIEKVYINEIPARLTAVSSGQVDMGIFPEPIASSGELGGLRKKVYELKEDYCPNVMVFTGKALKEKEKALRLFHQAYDKAVEDINRHPEEARDILMESIPNLKPGVRDLMTLPEYQKVSLPDKEYIEKIIRWTSKTLDKDLKVKADDLIDREFVKK